VIGAIFLSEPGFVGFRD